jgi:2,3,4,5-tetrahydropyridine-2,6-dicarboxylate N-succinyltransferase
MKTSTLQQSHTGVGLTDPIDLATRRDLEKIISQAWAVGPQAEHPPIVRDAIEFVFDALNSGRLRAAEREGVGRWTVNQWVKQALILSFPQTQTKLMSLDGMSYFDKFDYKYAGFDEPAMRANGVRIAPPAMVRRGAYIAPKVVVLPSFVNFGAYIDEESMVDSFVSVGTCAQIGKRVHLSMGVSIGGVLEPVQARPTIIEDNCFIGAHSSIVEGVVVEENAVIASGVHLTAGTRILDRATGVISSGRIPAGAVVIAGTLPSADGSYSSACAVIVKTVDAQTRAKTSINDLVRM